MNVFIIGAGFTKAVFPNAPLNGELLGTLANKNSNSNAAELKKKYGTEDIEIALTKLDLDIAQAGSVEQNSLLNELRTRIESELANYFRLFCASEQLMNQLPWLTNFINQAFNSGDVAISLNYDCVLEGALDCCGKWTPNGGYALEFPLGCGTSFPVSAVTVLKIHGSASFEKSSDLGKPKAKVVAPNCNQCFFPRSAKGKDFGLLDGKPFVIAPSYVKVPTVEIAYLMLDAIKAVANASAENLIVIGCSLRQADAFLKVLLANFGREEPSARRLLERKIIVVDPKAKEITNNLNNYWPAVVEDKLVPICNGIQDSVPGLVNMISNRSR